MVHEDCPRRGERNKKTRKRGDEDKMRGEPREGSGTCEVQEGVDMRWLSLPVRGCKLESKIITQKKIGNIVRKPTFKSAYNLSWLDSPEGIPVIYITQHSYCTS